MDKMRLCIFCAAFLAFCQSLVLGETVLLKSGQKVEGRIIENTDKYVKLDFHGVELTYYKDEVASIAQGVQGSGDTVSPQLESLYQAYTSSLSIPQNRQEEKTAEIPLPVVPQPAEASQAASTFTPSADLSQLPPEYQKMIQSIMQGAHVSQQAGGKPMAAMPIGMDLSKLPPEYQKVIKSTMTNLQAAKSDSAGGNK
ncbi:MAG: hypothetical protein PHC37_02020 [Candidatus Omnitrophica bacterium]|nr:hypothetical protein [Candidatus Omnitrophota bacterium]MDD5690464.1 hypothetical protein [Candidatus Omnitrophota bacterium]